jgi:hypothetical protein
LSAEKQDKTEQAEGPERILLFSPTHSANKSSPDGKRETLRQPAKQLPQGPPY